MVIAITMVTMAPMVTTSQAVSRKTASKTSNNTSGISATRVLARVELNGLRCWVKSDATTIGMDGNPSVLACAAPAPRSVRPIVTEITTVFNRLYPVSHPTRVDPVGAQAQVADPASFAEHSRSLARCYQPGSELAGRGRPASGSGGTRIQTMTAP